MESVIFETHAHYDDECYDNDREALLSGFPSNNVKYVINSGASVKGCYDTVALCEKYDFMYGSLGLHPDEVANLTDEVMDYIKNQAMNNRKIVAIGEIGLDYHWDTNPREVQKEAFIRQLELARSLDMPVVIHSRDAASDTFDIISEYAAKGVKGTIHCYSYSLPMALEYIKLGFCLGIGGVVTFTNGKTLKNVVKEIPLTSMVLETDSPYLAPVPHRGERNCSLYIELVAKAISQIKEVPYDEVLAVTCDNAKRLYRIN